LSNGQGFRWNEDLRGTIDHRAAGQSVTVGQLLVCQVAPVAGMDGKAGRRFHEANQAFSAGALAAAVRSQLQSNLACGCQDCERFFRYQALAGRLKFNREVHGWFSS
jgi:hypothetical protein